MVKVRVWDLPTRLGHWLLATSFVVAWVTAEREAWRLIHVKAGYVMLAVVAFRAAWGIVGTRHARFVAFAFPPRAALAYVATALRGAPQHYPGHNPAGGWSIFALLTLALCACVSGIADYENWGPRYVGDAHEALSIALLVMIGIHLAGVVAGSLLHHENLVAAMITGDKRASPEQAIPTGAGRYAVWLLVACVGVALLAR
jgi:cytochrome b